MPSIPLIRLCNCVGPPVCRYIFPESTASSQEVAVPQSLPLREVTSLTIVIVGLFTALFPISARASMVVLYAGVNSVSVMGSSVQHLLPRNRCAGLDPSPSVGVFIQSNRAQTAGTWLTTFDGFDCILCSPVRLRVVRI